MDPALMYRLRMRSGLLLPAGEGAFIEAEGAHDGLKRATIGEQSQHQPHAVLLGLQPIQDRALAGGKGLAAGLAFETALEAVLDSDVGRSLSAS